MTFSIVANNLRRGKWMRPLTVSRETASGRSTHSTSFGAFLCNLAVALDRLLEGRLGLGPFVLGDHPRPLPPELLDAVGAPQGALAAGADRFLTKPFLLAELTQTLIDLLPP